VVCGCLLCAAAAKALLDREDMDAEEVAKRAMHIAADLCVYTNHEFVIEVLDANKGKVAEA
jgi:ATP-dependent HslUV protease, peptidase subunit HslV